MRYLVYKIFTEEPVKISGQNKAEEAESSLDYIPGSAVRGAVVGAYLRRRNIHRFLEAEIAETHLVFERVSPVQREERDKGGNRA